MAKTVAEILKESGMSDEAIKALDAKVISGFTTILSTAQTSEQVAAAAKEEAETAKRAQKDLYDNQIAPGLDNWANEKASLTAERDYYRTQNQEARSGGFIPKEAPGYTPPTNPNPNPEAVRGADGRYVTGANPVPGSPSYLTKADAFTALSNAQWVQNEYFRLFKEPMPDDFEKLVGESVDAHLDFRTFASRKYKFEEKRTEIAGLKQKEHDDGIRKETAAAKDKEWAEKVGSNPNIRIAEPSQFSNLNKGVAAGQVKDPLKMSPEERHRATQSMIQKDISENSTVQ